MSQILKNMGENEVQFRELKDDEIDVVDGGFAYLVLVGGITATCLALSAVESFGEKLGKALYYATH
jgi:hypothetical protein